MYEKNLFFCSASPKSRKSLEIIINSARAKEEAIRGESLIIKTPDKDRRLVLFALFKASLLLATGRLRAKAVLALSQGDIPIGKRAIAATYRNPKTYKNKLLYYALLTKNIAKALTSLSNIAKYKNEIKACYVNDPSYLNGIYAEWCVKNEIPIYHNKYPYRLSRFLVGKEKNFSESLFVQPKKNYTDEELVRGERLLKERTFKSEAIDYMRDTPFSDYNKIHGNFDAVIYCHSFTDAQQDFGGDDSFLNMLDWLKFTVKNLENKRVLIKAHPNFFKRGYNTRVMDYDYHIFEQYKKQLQGVSNVTVVDWPARNIDVLQNLSPDCVLISHHGNALLEGAYLGFKCISSSAAPWKRYRLFNEWNSIAEYERLLHDFRLLEASNQKRLTEFIADLYSSYSFFDDRSWRVMAAKVLELQPREISRNSAILGRLTDEQTAILVSDVASEIDQIEL